MAKKEMAEKSDKTSQKTTGPIIVIGRQAGSGGRGLGKALAHRLSIPYYDKELLRECADRLGYDKEIFEMADERRPSPFRSFLSARFGVGETSPLQGEGIYQAQAKVIRQLGEHGSCVIVGRTADYILRDHPGLFSIFLHAPEKWRASAMASRGDAKSAEEALAILRREDSRRRDYYNYFTPGGWGKAGNYDICIDSSRFSPEQLVDIIEALAQGATEHKNFNRT